MSHKRTTHPQLGGRGTEGPDTSEFFSQRASTMFDIPKLRGSTVAPICKSDDWNSWSSVANSYVPARILRLGHLYDCIIPKSWGFWNSKTELHSS